METLKRRKPAPDAAADLLYLLTSQGGSARGQAPADRRRSFSVAFDSALGAYRWTFQEKRSGR